MSQKSEYLFMYACMYALIHSFIRLIDGSLGFINCFICIREEGDGLIMRRRRREMEEAGKQSLCPGGCVRRLRVESVDLEKLPFHSHSHSTNRL